MMPHGCGSHIRPMATMWQQHLTDDNCGELTSDRWFQYLANGDCGQHPTDDNCGYKLRPMTTVAPCAARYGLGAKLLSLHKENPAPSRFSGNIASKDSTKICICSI